MSLQTELPALPPSGADPDGGRRVRLLSYNIRSLRDDRRALVRVIRACEPDLICIQESPRYWRPEGQAAWLAHETGTVILSGGGRIAAGPLLLGTLGVDVLGTRDRLLPKTRGLHARGFATALVRVGGSASFAVTSCHLSVNADERLRQFALLPGQFEPGEHGVIGGDFNEHPEDPGWRQLAATFQDAHVTAPWGGTYTSRPGDPYQRLDAFFVTPGLRVLASGVPHGLPGVSPADLVTGTDHLPVLAVLRVPPPDAASDAASGEGPAGR
ncbi:endonuclease/exonuclease/phosphatase family protein [Kitasatospora sp. MAP5-34]|uniref:endonuclease/exonuclease/phosphatase family protein n=1 Tax=Kitasatospora sp. MAP5-34 TaxID=3035102 RepID=UPI0024760FAA|nr:endonuclease/exonuclease/phosphatase family protein [Kitasatospora sp. MAP5-34]MDH6575112.1 endonuclease/exonuclease/phosphatase family metal-dependent hydrolase [Kitasatospora sp. MAP5-34]